jgi:pimeloyl-ACP methyl ester carboxylesterase
VNTFATIGAGISVAAGVLGFIWPHRVSKVIGLGLPSQLAISEFRATYVRVAGAGHLVHDHAPEDYRRAVEAFLGALPPD